MSVRPLLAVDAYCDGCHRGFGYDPGIEESLQEPCMLPGEALTCTIRDTRRVMREYGWKTGKRLDFCPKCAAEKKASEKQS